MGKFTKAVLAFLLLFTLAGCATTRNLADGAPITPEDGVLVFHVTSRFPVAQLQYREFSTKNSFGYFFAEEFTGPEGSFLNKAGETYWVKRVKAGEYMWSKLLIDTRYAIFHGSNRFTIQPGKIMYVGHLTIDEMGGAARIDVQDREQEARAYLEANFPQYLKTMAFDKSVTVFDF